MNELFGQFPEEGELSRIAKRYHENCDAYDDVMLSGPIFHGDRMPANDSERKRMVVNARNELREAVLEGERKGFTPSEVQRAISLWGNLKGRVSKPSPMTVRARRPANGRGIEGI